MVAAREVKVEETYATLDWEEMEDMTEDEADPPTTTNPRQLIILEVMIGNVLIGSFSWSTHVILVLHPSVEGTYKVIHICHSTMPLEDLS